MQHFVFKTRCIWRLEVIKETMWQLCRLREGINFQFILISSVIVRLWRYGLFHSMILTRCQSGVELSRNLGTNGLVVRSAKWWARQLDIPSIFGQRLLDYILVFINLGIVRWIITINRRLLFLEVGRLNALLWILIWMVLGIQLLVALLCIHHRLSAILSWLKRLLNQSFVLLVRWHSVSLFEAHLHRRVSHSRAEKVIWITI